MLAEGKGTDDDSGCPVTGPDTPDGLGWRSGASFLVAGSGMAQGRYTLTGCAEGCRRRFLTPCRYSGDVGGPVCLGLSYDRVSAGATGRARLCRESFVACCWRHPPKFLPLWSPCGCARLTARSEREAEPTMDRQLPARDPLDVGAPICLVAVTGHGLPVRDLLDWTGYPIGR